MVWEGGSRKRSRPPPVKWSDTGCLTTMPSGRWMFSVLSGSSNARSWAGGCFPNSHVRMHAFRWFWKERKCSPLLTSFCPPHSHEVLLVPHPSALPVCHLLSALGTQPKFSVNTGGEKLFQPVFGLTNHTHTPHSAKNYSPNLNASADLAFGKLGQGPARPLRWRSITPTATQLAVKINISPTLHRDVFPHEF
jgi:hypothetical protein